jgi:hypothetical protein
MRNAALDERLTGSDETRWTCGPGGECGSACPRPWQSITSLRACEPNDTRHSVVDRESVSGIDEQRDLLEPLRPTRRGVRHRSDGLQARYSRRHPCGSELEPS